MSAVAFTPQPQASRTDSLDDLAARLGRSGALWRASDLGQGSARTWPSGFAALDAALPGAGWPTRCLSELLQPPRAHAEWRLLAPALAALLAGEASARLYLVAPPLPPHALGLAQLGLPADRLVWLAVDEPRARLWATEQLLQANPPGAILSWLPQAQAAQLRRLQVHAQACEGPVFIFRPQTALREASAAPLRVTLDLGPGWDLQLRVPKRRGVSFDDTLMLPALPINWRAVLPPRLRDGAPRGVAPLPGVPTPHAQDPAGAHTSAQAVQRAPGMRTSGSSLQGWQARAREAEQTRQVWH